jgi:ArsR family transcriptional regulator, arsenate/arsenite/antimonite-responsive transcriptional repressor
MSMRTPTRPALTETQFTLIAKALADPRRMALLEAISGGKECPCARLGSMFSVSKATISHHMKELVTAGLVESRRDGQYIHYCVRRGTLQSYAAELLRRASGKGDQKQS